MELVAFEVHGMQLFEQQHAIVTVIYVVGLIMYTFNQSDGSTIKSPLFFSRNFLHRVVEEPIYAKVPLLTQ